MLVSLAQLAPLFTTPMLAAAGALAIAIPIAIHFLSRRKRQQHPWGAMRFLLEAIKAHKRRLQMEQWALLLLRCLIVGLLGLALAGPMMSGCSNHSGRTVHVLIDDSLASRAWIDETQTRFEQLQSQANQLLDSLGPQDRVQLWRASYPAEPLTDQPSLDHAAAKRAIEVLTPRYSRRDTQTSLQQVAISLDAARSNPAQAVVILFSDLSRSQQRPFAEASTLDRLASRCRFWIARPMPARANMQVTRLEPRRAVVLPDITRNATVSATIEASRFGDLSRSQQTQLRVRLLDDRGGTLAEAARRLHWPIGQSAATVHVDIAIAEPTTDRELIVEAALDASFIEDALAEDNTAHAIVSLRRQLSVGLLVDRAAPDAPQQTLTPRQWLTLALSPTDASPMTIQTLGAFEAGESSAYETLDAVMVVAPSLLNDAAWDALATFARQGGLVWVWPDSSSEATWTASMRRAFSLDAWTIGWELAASEVGWRVETQAAPPQLRLLGADLESLLRPVRVWQRLPLRVPPSDRWIALRGADDDALLASTSIELGQLVLSSTALNVDWTNLPAKPMFVPLLHETLRGIIGSPRGQTTQCLAGSQPRLGATWSQINALRPPTTGEDQTAIALDHQADSQPTAALEQPGVWASTGEDARKLAVNVAAEAGDLLPIDEQRLAQQLSPLHGWQMLDRTDPGAALASTQRATNLSWPLLWLVLLLLCVETVLARWLSHAGVSSRDSWSRQFITKMISLRHDDSATKRKRAA